MPYPPRQDHLRAVEELKRHPTLTYTLIRNGFFMDYLGLPYTETNLHPLYCVLDLRSAKAVIPGDGTQPVIFTHSRDVGSFLAMLVDLPASQWPLESAIVGERVTLNELVDLVEKVTGMLCLLAPDVLFCNHDISMLTHKPEIVQAENSPEPTTRSKT